MKREPEDYMTYEFWVRQKELIDGNNIELNARTWGLTIWLTVISVVLLIKYC